MRGSWAGVSVRFAYDDYNVFEGAVTLKLNFVVVQFGSKTISRRDEFFILTKIDEIFWRFFSLFRIKKYYSHKL